MILCLFLLKALGRVSSFDLSFLVSAVISTLVFAMTFALPMISLFFASSIAVTAMPAIAVSISCLVFRHIYFIIPLIAHKIDRTTAGIVLLAMPLPIFFVSRWDMQVQRLRCHPPRRGNDHDRSWINELRLWKVSDVNMSIKTGLTNADRNTEAGRIY